MEPVGAGWGVVAPGRGRPFRGPNPNPVAGAGFEPATFGL